MGKWDIKWRKEGMESPLNYSCGIGKEGTEEEKQKLSPLSPLIHKATSLMNKGASSLHRPTSKSIPVSGL